MRKRPVYNKSKLPDHRRFIRKTRKTSLSMKEQGAKNYCASCPLGKNVKDCNCYWICDSKYHYTDKYPNKAKKKANVKLLNVDLGTRTSKYALVFGYKVYLNDKSVYKLILEYSEDLKENSFSNSDQEYLSKLDEKSLTLHRVNIFYE